MCFLSLCYPRAQSQAHSLRGDGFLRLFYYHTQELKSFQFRNSQGKIQPNVLNDINLFLASREDKQVYPIDVAVLDLVDYLQDFYQIDTVEIISGFRSNDFNQKLLKTGHHVSPVSLHTQGKALDVHFDEVSEEELNKKAQSLQAGGVGYYGNLDFIHLDVGAVRFWTEANLSRKFVGLLQEKFPLQLLSSQNDYFPKQAALLELKYLDASSTLSPTLIKNLKLQHFYRGQWIDCDRPLSFNSNQQIQISFDHFTCSPLKSPKLGRYRVLFHVQENQLSSNEFYFRKK